MGYTMTPLGEMAVAAPRMGAWLMELVKESGVGGIDDPDARILAARINDVTSMLAVVSACAHRLDVQATLEGSVNYGLVQQGPGNPNGGPHHENVGASLQ